MNPQQFLRRTTQIVESFTQDEETIFLSDRYQEVPHLEFPAIVLKDDANSKGPTSKNVNAETYTAIGNMRLTDANGNPTTEAIFRA